MKEKSVCLFARRLYTGRQVRDGVYLGFAGTRITGLSSRPTGELAGEFPVVTPAFIDPHSHIGMVRAGEPSAEGESNDQQDSLLALADALDSVQMDDPAFREAVEMGVLYSCAMPGSGNIIGGASAVIRHYGANSSAALIRRAGIKGAFGFNPMATREWKGTRPTTRMGAIAILRRRLSEVARKTASPGRRRNPADLSAEEKIIDDLLSGRQRLRAHVHKIDDIAALLRLVDEFGLAVTVEHAMDVHRPGIFEELRRRDIPVVFGPLDGFAYKVELKHESWRNIRYLLESGVRFGLMTDHPVTPARQIFLQTRWFVRSGLSKQEAVEIVSRRNAEVLGIDDILGTLEKGKWASFIGWSADPFDLTSFPAAVFGEGAPLFRETAAPGPA